MFINTPCLYCIMTFYEREDQITCDNCNQSLYFNQSNNISHCNKVYKLEKGRKGFEVTRYSAGMWEALKSELAKDVDLTVESLSPTTDEIVDEETESLLEILANGTPEVELAEAEVIVPLTEVEEFVEEEFGDLEELEDEIELEELVEIEEVLNEDTDVIINDDEPVADS